ncbi:Ankyrin repeat-containing domain protein [Amanita muscaria]
MSSTAVQSQTVAEPTMSERQFLDIWTAAVQKYQADNGRPVPAAFANIHTLADLLVRIAQRRDKLLKPAERNKLTRPLKKVLHASFDFMKQVAATQPPFGALLGVSESIHLPGDENEIPNMFDSLKRFLERLSSRLDTPVKPALRDYVKDIFFNLLVLLDDMKEKMTIAFPKRLRGTLAKLKQLLEEESAMTNVEILEQQANITDLLRDPDPVLRWLSAPDVSTSHDDAVNKRHGNSGGWFMSRDDYNKWKTEENSFMWIRGMTGSGKTVLCASIIKDLGQGNDLAYFYFDTNRQEQNSFIQLLTSLVSSLYKICEDRSCFRNVDRNRRPKPIFLNEVLQNMLRSSKREVYLVIDALDECREGDLDEVLGFIKAIRRLNCSNCHVLVTSREKDEIKVSFQEMSPIINVDLSAMAEDIKSDIKSYIEHELQCDKQLQRWGDEGKDLILKELVEQHDGMFRLVACQLSGLKKCFSSMQGLKEALASLPKTLQDSYQKTMDSIPVMNRLTVDKLLMWLACSFSPLSLPELAAVVAFDDVTYEQNDELVLHNAQDITRFCSDLVHVTTDGKVILAHASVKAFLLSYHFKLGGGAKLCHAHVTKICIQSAVSGFERLEEYSKLYWASHLIQEELMDDDTIVEMSKPLFMDLHEKFASYNFLDNDYYHYFKPSDGQPSSPLVYASLLGMSKTVDWLLNQRDFSHDLNLALLSASYQGHADIIDSLLKRGAKIDATHVDNTTALQFASIKPHLEVVRLLIKRGANVDQKGYQGGTVLHSLALRGHDNLVRELLERTDITVTIDAVDDLGCTPLHVASTRGCLAVMEALLDKGANVNEHGTKGTALHFASYFGHTDVIKLLLKRNAYVDARNAVTGTPLHAACYSGRLDAVQLLLESGADVNLSGGQAGTALRAALHNGDIKTRTLLSQYGAIINMQASMEDPAFQDLVAMIHERGLGKLVINEYGDIQDMYLYLVEKDIADELLGRFGIELRKSAFEIALQGAARAGDIELLKHLLQLKAKYKPDIDEATSLGWALGSASRYGQLDVMNFLMARQKFDNCFYNNALNVAVFGERDDAVELLFEKVAFDLTPGCLHSAAYKGNEKVIRSLLDRGVDVDTLIGNDRSALDDALASAQPRAARMLIEECGADIHGKGERAGEPIGIAAQNGYLDIVELMMKKGMNKNEFVIALGRACGGKQTDVVQHLLGYENRLKELTQDDLQAILEIAGENRDDETALMAEEKIKECMAHAEEDGPEREGDGNEEQGGGEAGSRQE